MKIRGEGRIKDKVVYVALAFNAGGEKRFSAFGSSRPGTPKSSPGLEPAIKARGVNGFLIAVADGLKGFPEATTTAFPQTIVQTCIVHRISSTISDVEEARTIGLGITDDVHVRAADVVVRRGPIAQFAERNGGRVDEAQHRLAFPAEPATGRRCLYPPVSSA